MLHLFLGARNDNTYLKPVPSRAAVHALISLGEPGIQVLYRALVDTGERRIRYRGAIIEALYCASRGEPLPWAPVAPRVDAIEQPRLCPDLDDRHRQTLLGRSRRRCLLANRFADVLHRLY